MKPLRVGLTGGIASGKTTVANLFAARGVPVIDTDEIARDIVKPGMPVLERLVTEFGGDILDATGELDRRRMRERVFADVAQRRRLEAIMHPAIREELERRSAKAGGTYQILVIPLLVETDAQYIDRVLVVDCNVKTQVARLLARDAQTTEKQARTMLAAQASRAERLARANDVMTNDGSLGPLALQVEALHGKYLALARQRERPSA